MPTASKWVLDKWASGWHHTSVLHITIIFVAPIKKTTTFFSCESTKIINLCCSDTYQLELVTTILAALLTLPPFALTLASYVCIIFTILRIPSTTGRQKAALPAPLTSS
ncbi:unnamed protein product [Natator depressus]